MIIQRDNHEKFYEDGIETIEDYVIKEDKIEFFLNGKKIFISDEYSSTSRCTYFRVFYLVKLLLKVLMMLNQ